MYGAALVISGNHWDHWIALEWQWNLNFLTWL